MRTIRDEAADVLREVYVHLTRRARDGDLRAWTLLHELDRTAPEIAREAEASPVTFTAFSPGSDQEERAD